MRKTFKAIGYIFMAVALLRVWFDFSATTLQDREFRLAEAGAVWAGFHRESLLGLQPGVERYLAPWVWESVIAPVLYTPLAPILAVLGVFFLIAGAAAPKLR